MYLDGIRVLRVQFAPLIYRHLYIDISAEPLYVLARVSLCYCHRLPRPCKGGQAT